MIQNTDRRYAYFRKLSLATLIAVYFLILVGGIVRSTGSGMGCPDWPKCFGSWVPPTSESDLPDNYQEMYSMHRQDKNIKFAKYLNALGMNEVSARILEDKSILQEEKFNAAKTWTEYTNRLVGAVIGIMIFATTLSSFSIWKENRTLVLMAILTLFTVGFQGWIGSVVVSTKLLPWLVTVHMLLALVIVAMITFLGFKGNRKIFRFELNTMSILIVVSMLALSVQILIGTQVREGVDLLTPAMLSSGNWFESIGATFYFHRTFSLFILAVNLYLLYKLTKEVGKNNPNYGLSRIICVLIMVEIITGVSMAYFSVPPFLQPVHLLLGALLFGLSFLLLLNLSSVKPENVYRSE